MKKLFIILGVFVFGFNCSNCVKKVEFEIPNAKESYIAIDEDSTLIELINDQSPGIFRVHNQKKRINLSGYYLYKKQTKLHTPVIVFYPSDSIVGLNEQYPAFAFKIMKFDPNVFHARLMRYDFYSCLGIFDQSFKFKKM